MVKPKGKQGFASMSPERRRELGSKGRKGAAKENRPFALDRKLAARAGRKGGKAIPAEKRAFRADRELAAEAGRKGRIWSREKGRS